MPKPEDDEPLEPLPEFDNSEFRRLSEIQRKVRKFREAATSPGLSWDQKADIASGLLRTAIEQADAKRQEISDAKSDDVDRRRELVHQLAAEIRASRPTLSARSLATLIHARLKADPSLSPSEVLGVEAIRKILRDQRKSG